MSFDSIRKPDVSSADEMEVRLLYRHVLDGWNQHSTDTFTAPFAPDGEVIGFDGSQMIGRVEIASTLGQIFADHVTAPYVSKIKSVRLLSSEVAALRAIVGMVPPGQSDLNPAVNAHQTLVAAKGDGTWRAELFQTTPAQFHGRPDLVQQMTEELRQVLK
ncbi:MAG TPA: SgcJ/EcaC family oxidoreductase [Ktedonobacteraceae bacterium]|nr:SgcJ/EcaC family oxidoreductase [Ktedonobacteraceae bacterium]